MAMTKNLAKVIKSQKFLPELLDEIAATWIEQLYSKKYPIIRSSMLVRGCRPTASV